MPGRTEKVHRLNEEAGEYELPYLSKSRIMSWVKNPEHFRLKYLEGIREPETFPMKRGTNIHETFERYYEYIQGDYTDRDRLTMLTLDEMIARLPNDRGKWADFIEPYISNFFQWEVRRWEAIDDVLDFRPVGIEEEYWRDPVLGLPAEPEWMGLADVVLPAASVPSVEGDEGVVIVDFKTGSVPAEKYRNPGIYTELEYYEILFEDKYDVAGAMAYYPKTDQVVVKPDDDDLRDDVLQAVEDLVHAVDAYEGDIKFQTDPGPLCGWGTDEGERSALYGVCSQCTWNVPPDNRNQFEALVEEGYSDRDIAQHLGCKPRECSYWRNKLDL